jgi:hypothetical protein
MALGVQVCQGFSGMESSSVARAREGTEPTHRVFERASGHRSLGCHPLHHKTQLDLDM